MASDTGKSIPIHAARTVSGNQPAYRRLPEEATQTFLDGTPVQIDTGTSGVQAWPGDGGNPVTDAIVGFSGEAASNLVTVGVAKTLTFGSVPNQPLAVNIPRGAPLNDGKVGFEVAVDDSIFHGQGNTTMAVTDVGKSYGLAIDTDLHWYVDKTDAVNVCVRIVGLDENDPRGCYFVVIRAAQQLLA